MSLPARSAAAAAATAVLMCGCGRAAAVPPDSPIRPLWDRDDLEVIDAFAPPDGRGLLVADGTRLCGLDPATGRTRWERPGWCPYAAFAGDGTTVCTFRTEVGRAFRVVDTESGRALSEVAVPAAPAIRFVRAALPGGRLLAVADLSRRGGLVRFRPGDAEAEALLDPRAACRRFGIETRTPRVDVLVVRGSVALCSLSSRLVRLDTATGNLRLLPTPAHLKPSDFVDRGPGRDDLHVAAWGGGLVRIDIAAAAADPPADGDAAAPPVAEFVDTAGVGTQFDGGFLTAAGGLLICGADTAERRPAFLHVLDLSAAPPRSPAVVPWGSGEIAAVVPLRDRRSFVTVNRAGRVAGWAVGPPGEET